jgi:DNA-binding transcriptional LysR family regulator
MQRRIAVRYADMLKLQVLDVPYPTNTFPIVAVHRQDQNDAAIRWFIEKIRQSAATGQDGRPLPA